MVGDTTALPPDLEDDMRTTGLTHLSAVSGANFTLVCGTVLLVLTALGAGRVPRLAVAAVAAVGFVVLARPEPSVLRAAAMGLVGLVGLAGSRRAAGVPALAVAVVLLCVLDPWLSRSAGFALSVLATGGLLLLAGPWTRTLARALPLWAAAAVAVPLAAQAVCSPVTVLLTPQLSLVAVPANVLVAPAVAPATVLGVVAALLAPVWPQGAAGVAWLAGWAVRWIALVARRGADLPHAAVPWPEGVGGAVLLAGVTVLGAVAIALAVHRSSGRRLARSSVRGRGPRLAVVAAAGVVLCAVGIRAGLADPVLGRWFPVPTTWPGEWEVAACDVGQGQALVVRTDETAAVVVDAGPDPDLVDRCLDDLGVERVELLVLTHFHADHVAGLPGVLRGRAVDAVLVSPLGAPEAGARGVSQELSAAGLEASAPPTGTVVVLGPAAAQVVVEVLGPVPPFDASGAAGVDDPDEAANDASLVLHVRTPTTTLLATGDAEPPAQRALLGELRGRPDLLPGRRREPGAPRLGPAGAGPVRAPRRQGRARERRARQRLRAPRARGARGGVAHRARWWPAPTCAARSRSVRPAAGCGSTARPPTRSSCRSTGPRREARPARWSRGRPTASSAPRGRLTPCLPPAVPPPPVASPGGRRVRRAWSSSPGPRSCWPTAPCTASSPQPGPTARSR